MQHRLQRSSNRETRFDHVYNLADPRGYFRTLRPLEYRTPEYARPIFDRCARALGRLRGKPGVRVLDLCCGYGVNAALLKHDVEMNDLYARYGVDEAARVSTDQLIEADRRYYAKRRKPAPVTEVIGIDPAENAVRYAKEVGLIEFGAAINLEQEAPSEELAARIRSVDLVTITGGIGYVSGTTFRRLLERTAPERRPWIACFPLRTVSFEPLREACARYGLETEAWTKDTYPQRRFASAEERHAAMRELAELKLDPTDKEEDGYLHAVFQLIRPAREIAVVPLERLGVPPRRPPRSAAPRWTDREAARDIGAQFM